VADLDIRIAHPERPFGAFHEDLPMLAAPLRRRATGHELR
jgi:hypothetical protein